MNFVLIEQNGQAVRLVHREQTLYIQSTDLRHIGL